MRAFDQLIASNQADALAQMAQEPNVVRRMAGKLKDIPVAQWAALASWQMAGLLAIGALAGTPLTAHADDYQPIYQSAASAPAQAPAVYATAQTPATYPTAQTASANYAPAYQQAPQPAPNPVAGLGTAVRTVVGAGIGGVVGHLFGGGNGRTVMTAAGVVAGGAIGNSIGSNERPVTQAQNYSANNPNPYPQQTPPAAGGNASGPNLGTLVGGGLGALIGNQFGNGRGRVVTTVLGAGLGAITGTHVENAAINNSHPNYQRVLEAQDESGACFAQWSGRIQPTQSLANNPQAEGAMRQAVGKLGEAYDGYTNEASHYRQDQENTRWTVDVNAAQSQKQILNQETRQMVDAEKKYVYYRGTFMEKCNMAAERGYDVRAYNQARQLLTLDTGGYTYQSPTTTQTATYGTARRPGY